MNWKDKFPKENRYWESENGILYNADCFDVLKSFPENSIDLIVTSPPYDSLRYYFTKSKKEIEALWNFEKFKLIATQVYRITKQGGVLVWVVGDETINGSETGTSFKQALYFKENCGFNLHDTMIYEKNSVVFPEKRRYYQIFKYMFIFSKGIPKTVNLIKDRQNIQYKKVRRSIEERQKNGTIHKKNKCWITPKFSVRTNIWKIDVGYNKSHTDKIAYKHPATFPEKLANDHIISWSNKYEIVLDIFCGSGTTAKIAEKLNRKWIGVEISPEYCKIAKKRIQQEANQLKLWR